MKIALVHKKYTTIGGTERMFVTLAEALSNKGHEVHIFCNEWKNVTNNDMVFHKVPIIKWGFLRKISFMLFSKTLLRKDKFDIICGFDRTIYQDIIRVGGGCHRELLKHYINTYEGWLVKLFKKISLENALILYIERIQFRKENYRKIITISEKSKNDILKNYNVPSQDIVVIYNGVDLERFNPNNKKIYRNEIRQHYGIVDRDILILYVGNGFRRKGVRYLIKSIANLNVIKAGSHIKVFIVGRESERKGYERLTEKLGLSNKIIFTGERSDVEKFYATSDIFILPTIYEPFGNVCLEAMASGMPVITSKISGASEIMTDGVDAFIVNDPMNISEITERIIELLDEKKRELMGRKARETAEKYSIESNYEKVVQVYREVLNIKKSA